MFPHLSEEVHDRNRVGLGVLDVRLVAPLSTAVVLTWMATASGGRVIWRTVSQQLITCMPEGVRAVRGLPR